MSAAASEGLWSPQMRKWMRDADRHGIRVRFARRGRYTSSRWEGGGGVAYLERMTDDEGLRVLDSASGRLNTGQPRRIDYPTSHRGPTPPLVAAGAAIAKMNIKVGGQTILTFGKTTVKI